MVWQAGHAEGGPAVKIDGVSGGRTGDGTSRSEAPFGARLRGLREAAGFTQEELALKAGLSPNAVGALERGARKRPYPHTVRALADALSLSEKGRASLLAAVPGRGGAAPSSREVAPEPSPPLALPHPPTGLLGRERELEEVAALLGRGDVRLLTLTGTGGVGKTRLALEAAREAAELFADGTAFVGLASLSSPSQVAPEALRSLGLGQEDHDNPGEALRAHLNGKRLLLVLDNFEHLLPDAAPEISALVEACPDLSVLATSRAPLRVRGEQEYPVPPLALPPSTREPAEDDVAGSPSGRLFLERARAVSSSFAITPENAEAVATICWRLAGLPLALELAAARVRFLDPATLLSRLDRALSTSWARDLPERQRTMRATLDWSHGLLSEAERALFRRLSAFVGGFTLEAAETVGAGEDLDEWAVLDHLGALVDHSLVWVAASPGAPPPGEGETEARYGMLEPVRQYARQKLGEDREEAEAAARAHAEFFLALSEAAAQELRGPRQVGWLDRLETESANLRSAISWALAAGEAGIATRFGWALWVFWWLRGYQREGRRWMEALLDTDPPAALRARAVQVANAMAYTLGDFEACEGYSAEALALSREAGDTLGAAYALCGLGLDAVNRGEFGAAASRFEEALPLFRRSGEKGQEPIVRVWLGTVLLAGGDRDRAVAEFEEGLDQARRRGDRLGSYNALYNLAQVAQARGDHALAFRMLEEGVSLSWEMGDRANLAYFLEGLAVAVGLRGEDERAAVLLGASEGSLEVAGAPVYNYYRPDAALRERVVAEARAVLGGSAFEGARERGRSMTFEQAVEYALGRDAPRRSDGPPRAR